MVYTRKVYHISTRCYWNYSCFILPYILSDGTSHTSIFWKILVIFLNAFSNIISFQQIKWPATEDFKLSQSVWLDYCWCSVHIQYAMPNQPLRTAPMPAQEKQSCAITKANLLICTNFVRFQKTIAWKVALESFETFETVYSSVNRYSLTRTYKDWQRILPT